MTIVLKDAQQRLLAYVGEHIGEKMFNVFLEENSTPSYTGQRLFWGLDSGFLLIDLQRQETWSVEEVSDQLFAREDVHPALLQLVLEDIEKTYKKFLDKRKAQHSAYFRNYGLSEIVKFEDWEPPDATKALK